MKIGNKGLAILAVLFAETGGILIFTQPDFELFGWIFLLLSGFCLVFITDR